MLPGMIVAWKGSIATIPTGYVFCDGTHGTPDMRNVVPAGAQEDDAGVAKTNISGALTVGGGNTSHTHGTPTTNVFGADSNAAYQEENTDSASHLPPYKTFVWMMKT